MGNTVESFIDHRGGLQSVVPCREMQTDPFLPGWAGADWACFLLIQRRENNALVTAGMI